MDSEQEANTSQRQEYHKLHQVSWIQGTSTSNFAAHAPNARTCMTLVPVTILRGNPITTSPMQRKFWPVPLVDPVGANKDEDANDDGTKKEPVKKETTKKEPVKKEPVEKEPVKEEEEPAKDEDARDGVYSVGGDGDGRATPSRLVSKDDDGLPVNTRPATPGADEPVILDANGAPVVMPDSDDNVRRKFEGGECLD